MLKRVTITNYRGESVRYEIEEAMTNVSEDPDWTSPEAAGLLITEIEGLGPVKANINLTELSSSDGAFFNSARLSSRNIVISGRFMHAESIEEARLLSYKYFPIKSKVTVKVETDNRTGVTTGYVESNEPVIFSKESDTQISIICESPFFEGEKIEEELIYDTEKQITYDGDASNGMLITAIVGATATPVDSFRVEDFKITKDDGILKLDTAKMSKIVPNSAPNDTPLSKCSYIFDTYGHYKVMEVLSYSFESVFSVFYHGEVHFFARLGVTSQIYHFKIDSTTKKLVQLTTIDMSDEPSYASLRWLLVARLDPDVEESEIIVGMTTQNEIVRFNGSTFIRFINTSFPFMPTYTSTCKGVVHNNLIYMFITEHSDGTVGHDQNHLYVLDVTTPAIDYIAGPGDPEFLDMFPSYGYSSSGYYNFSNAQVVSMGNLIYVIGGNGDYQKDIRFYEPDSGSSNKWHLYENVSNVSCYAINGISYKSGIPYVIAYYQSNYQLMEFRGVGGFTARGESPSYEMTSINTPTFGCDGTYFYILGNNKADQVSGRPNNVVFIEGDRVIIDTFKGKKSIILIRDDKVYNILNTMTKESTWISFHNGLNKLTYSATGNGDEVVVVVSTAKLYEGV